MYCNAGPAINRVHSFAMLLSSHYRLQHSRKHLRVQSTCFRPLVVSPRARGQRQGYLTAAARSGQQDIGANFDIESRVAFLEEDLKHLFDDQGIAADAYAEVVDFKDPVSPTTEEHLAAQSGVHACIGH